MRSKNIFWMLWGGFFLLLVYWAFRLWGHFPAFMDTVEYVFPEKWFSVECFRQGRIPLWNPYIACGTPHLASFQPGVFYPFFWLWNITGLTDWFFLLALLHQAFAAVGFYLWLKSLKVSPILATLCSIGFAGSAVMTFYWGFPTHLASISWVPWIFWASQRLTEKQNISRWLLFSFSWAFQILAGYPFFTFYAALLLAVWMWTKSTRDLRIHFAHGTAFLAALGLTACQWLPFIDFLGSLHREGWGDYLYNLHWSNYLTLFEPQVLGMPGMADYKGDYPDFIFNNLYLGIVPLVLFVVLFFSSKARDLFWKGAALFWFFWLPGIHFFAWKILPGAWMDKLEPAKSAFLFVFCAFTGLAVGLSEHLSLSSKKSGVWKAAWVLGVLWILDILLVPSRVIQIVPDPYRNGEVLNAATRAGQLVGNGRLVSLKETGKFYPGETETLSGSVLETADELAPNTNVVWGLRSARGYLTIFTDGFQNLNRYLKMGYPYDGRVLDSVGTRLIIGAEPLSAFKYRSSEKRGSSIWTRNSGALAEAWKVDQVREFPDRPALFEALLDPKAFLENEVYTEKSSGGGAVCLARTLRQTAASTSSFLEKLRSSISGWIESPTTIDVTRSSPCESSFLISSDRPGFLVFNESFSPGWHAWVDGEPQPIFRAYGLIMAVPMDKAGKIPVLFRYEPNSFRLGLFLSLVILSSLGVLGISFTNWSDISKRSRV